MKKSKVGHLIIAFLLAWLLAQFFFYSVTCTATELPPQLTISRTQYLELKNIINEQESLLTQLEEKLQTLEQTSPELLKTLSEQKALLTKTQERLRNAETLLALSKIEQEKLNQSLQTLSEQIKKQKDVSRRRERQKAFWCVVGGVVVGLSAK
ncbi:hypothetical protein [Phascolarctobacterium faecium]|uniref:hypothetical protein n=1 Tax=Phascolarctobacterium faecium TaxID=33025 RepID=UPI003AB27916